MDAVPIQKNEVLKLVELVSTTLNEKQILILENLNGKNATQLILQLNSEEKIAQSTLWHNLRLLKKTGIIDFGSGKVQLTEIGEIIFEFLSQRGVIAAQRSVSNLFHKKVASKKFRIKPFSKGFLENL